GTGPLRRSQDDCLVGGVAGGLAQRMGWDPTIVRTVFVLAALLSGFGAVPYVLAWLGVPADGEKAILGRALTDRRGITAAVGLASLLVVILLVGSALSASWLGSLLSP